MKINKILIANRGEIALRIMRTAKKMNILTNAVYSDADKDSSFVKSADQKVYLPGSRLTDTYLNIEKIIEVAKSTGADAIHPGYGFLSENPLFAEACERNGIIFIGPSSEAIRAMGNKIAARNIAIEHGIPVTPGITGDVSELISNYHNIGFPMLVKAAAGGGGKGMRIVRSEEELLQALKSTASEAASYFGDSTIYIERFFENPRHIEVQILGDKAGNVIHLFERECSVQRRHQKIIEEAPSPTLDDKSRDEICRAAVQLASSIGYFNAGTIEFLVDEDLNFYFLEMNTRIQVEHPVTEETTGIDIVKEQILIAEGKSLSLSQIDVKQSGHAIELRVYAEDPENNFIPSPGKIIKYSYDRSLDIRLDDSGLHDNSEVTGDFDPMIGKIIAHGNTREEAISKLIAFLENYSVFGIKSNVSFLFGMLRHPDFINNRINTRYIDNSLSRLNQDINQQKVDANTIIPLAGALMQSLQINSNTASVWNEIGYWRHIKEIPVTFADRKMVIPVNQSSGKGKTVLTIDGENHSISLSEHSGLYDLMIDSNLYKMNMVTTNDNQVVVKYKGFEYMLIRDDIGISDLKVLPSVKMQESDAGDIISPMPGKVLRLSVAEGDEVKKGDVMMVIEAMKMENNIIAPYTGIVDKILIREGESVSANAMLVHLVQDEVSIESKG